MNISKYPQHQKDNLTIASRIKNLKIKTWKKNVLIIDFMLEMSDM